MLTVHELWIRGQNSLENVYTNGNMILGFGEGDRGRCRCAHHLEDLRRRVEEAQSLFQRGCTESVNTPSRMHILPNIPASLRNLATCKDILDTSDHQGRTIGKEKQRDGPTQRKKDAVDPVRVD